ncbi:prepilin-type N-terminal cleavage/methylation domain-containing protein [Telluria beijingensis]|uniref:prepilin-type N-terminal cleavage/methylation domain-containing protein n=1 Tax=Telluria beijingensis TaxID=3068633 RepID=UPI002795B8C2|nr:prepilin-type N-terminal cleavage/methylation domain-containing protein [Massilia sp. REN29]
MNTGSRHAGFTLVELLVAIGILAMVAVLGWRGLDGIVRARVALTQEMETTRGMQLAFAQMQNDCENAAGSELMRGQPSLLWDADRLTLVRKVYVEHEPSRLQVVSYRVVNGQLIRRESPGTRDLDQVGALWQALASDAPADNSPSVVLQVGVNAMQVQGWQNNAWRNEPTAVGGTGEQPPPGGGVLPQPGVNPLEPTGVQVALTVQGLGQPMVKSFLLGGT